MRKMKRLSIIIIIIIVLILVVPVSLWFLVFEKPIEKTIEASPDDLIITLSDLSGWEPNVTNGMGFGYGWHGNPPLSISQADSSFHNNSTTFSMAITVKSFQSSGAAHEFFLALTDYGNNINGSVRSVDEASIVLSPSLVQNHSNYSLFYTGFYWYYYFRIANVIGILTFGQIDANEPAVGPPTNPEWNGWYEHASAIQPPTQEWMDQIVSVQVQKIH